MKAVVLCVVVGVAFGAMLPAAAAPGDVLFSDDFERSNLQPTWSRSSSQRAGTSAATANSGSRSMYTRHDPVSVTLNTAIDLAVPGARLTAWIRRGSDTFSEDPDPGEDLVLEYFSAGGAWVVLDSLDGGGIDGEILNVSYLLGPDALHAGFLLRFRQTAGSGNDWDYWHIDDVTVTETEATALQCDDFDDGQPYSVSFNGGGFVGVSGATFSSSPNAMTLNGGRISVDSAVKDTSSGLQFLSVWVRRGADAFSEDTDNGENLVLQYRNSVGSWITLETFLGSGSKGQVYQRTYDLSGTPQATHSSFQIRWTMTNGSGAAWDFWHIDDVCLSTLDATVPTQITISHDLLGQYCVTEPVTLSVVDTSGVPIADYVGTVDLSVSTGAGAWSVITGAGNLSDADTSDGLASYTFNASDNGSVVLGLTYSAGAPAVDIDGSESSGATDDDSEGLLTFSPSGITITANQLSNPPPGVINDPIGPQTAGVDFELHLAAFGGTPEDATCGVIEAIDGPRQVNFWQSWENPGSGSVTATVGGTAVGSSQASANAVSVNFSSGQAVLLTKYKDVGSIRIFAQDGTTAAQGSTNPFVVKPAGFQFSRIASASGIPNPGASTASGAAFVPAAEAFQVDVTVVDAEGSTTPNFGLESPAEGVMLSSGQLLVPASGRNGSSGTGLLINGGSFNLISPGVLNNASVAFDEVGVIRLSAAVADGDYLGAGDVATLSSEVGRFYVDEFVLQSATLTPSCGTFTYMGEDALGVAFEVHAVNVLDDRVFNYDTTLLGAGNVAAIAYAAEQADTGIDLGARLAVTGAAWQLGQYNLTDANAVFQRDAAVDGPFDVLSLGINLTDPLDSRVLRALDMHAGTSGDCVTAANCTAKRLGTTRVYYGRFFVYASQGPEDLDLDVPVAAQLWDGESFVQNLEDSCTDYATSVMSLDNFTDSLAVGETTPIAPVPLTSVVSGYGSAGRLSAPGVGNEGSVRITVDVPAWLEFDWFGGGVQDPQGILQFGRYRGSDRIVYWREATR